MQNMRTVLSLLIFSLWTAALLSQAPPVHQRAKVPSQSAETTKSASTDSGSPNLPPITINNLPAPPDPQRASEEKRYREEQATYNRRIAACTLALAIFACAQVIAMGFQYYAMKHQGRAAEAAIQSSKDMNRAWIVLTFIDVPHGIQKVKNGHVRTGRGFNWTVRNSGGSPAFIRRIGARFHRVSDLTKLPNVPDIETDIAGMPTSHFPNQLSIGPGETICRYTLADTSKGDNTPVTVEEYAEVSNGKAYWLGYGVVEYRIVFDDPGTIRETRFCYRWVPGNEDNFIPWDTPSTYTMQT
jgi:hypothetical protein